jgi:hypothetical protein
MTWQSILRELWDLPWYDVFCVAFFDDFILLAKVWPVAAAVIGLGIAVRAWADRRQ